VTVNFYLLTLALMTHCAMTLVNVNVKETMSVCLTVYKIFSVKQWRVLETGGRGRSRSLKMAPFDRSYSIRLYIGRPL